MIYTATEYLNINLDTEKWECRVCNYVLGSARDNYKKYTKIYNRNPREIHRPKLDPTVYKYTFSPDPAVCAIYEFYCPGCGTMIDVEYTVPGHLPIHDFELDIDSLKARYADQMPPTTVGEGPDVTGRLRSGVCGHNHSEENSEACKQ